MDAVEWAWWHRVWREMPFGPKVEDERLAILSARMFNAFGTERTVADMRFEWSPPAESDDHLIDFAAGASALAEMFPKR